jgi:rhamnose utilization protein RhaD (predicted bifunctional aldolase and dehydrogenase)/NAD(P)-dependent dehydrogenase (short-subunit alcohol dehydrogenase family)
MRQCDPALFHTLSPTLAASAKARHTLPRYPETTMQSLYIKADAEAMVARYGEAGVPRDLALRVYTTRLLGSDPRLVLHGGGNTSVKTRLPDLLGREADVLCVKGSGADMAKIEPAGLPAVRLDELRMLRARPSLSDEEMVRVQRANLLDPMAPNPSVETLLHAFVPHKFVDHTHSTAVLALIDQPDGEARTAEVYNGRMAVVPYIMPGFALAKKAAGIFDADPAVAGFILLKHGIFTFGGSDEEAYERMIEMVSLAEARLRQGRLHQARRAVFATAHLPQAVQQLAEAAPIIRGACALKDPAGAHRRLVMEFRCGDAVMNFVNGVDVGRYATAGVVTPDHTIRTKNWPLVVDALAPGADFAASVAQAAAAFMAHYRAYFERHNARVGGVKKMLDPQPRVVLVPGLGLFGLGRSKKDARIAADIAENAVETITDAEATGRFESISEADMFDMEYWSLEQAKLGAAKELPLAGEIAAITGGAGAIGAATAKAFAAAGAEIAILDVDEGIAQATAKAIGGAALPVRCDVTDIASVQAAFDKVVETFGGVDIVVSNAGAAWQGRIGEVDEAVIRKSFELNFYGHQRVAQAAVRIMRAQGTGGCLLFNTSKQAINPGPNFGPYGLPKAATLFLARQYALDYGADGIRANAVNADRVRSGLLTDAMIADRAKARGVSVTDYMSGNLLGREVTAEDVAQAFLAQALALKTTADVTTVDGGNIAAALR